MRVSKTEGGKGVDGSRKTKKSADSGQGFADALRDVSGAEAPQQAAATGGVSSVDAILAVQQTADATDHRSRGLMMTYGNDLLDRLEQIRVAILRGSISKERLHELARKLREHTTKSDDPTLNDLVAEIELRVEVEIAKLTR